MRIFSRTMTFTLSLGLIGFLFAPLLHAQDYPADITRGKAAASEGPEAYPLGYVEDLNDARTTLAGFFSMLSAFLCRVGNKRRIELLHLGAAAFRACHFGGFMLLQGQDHQ